MIPVSDELKRMVELIELDRKRKGSQVFLLTSPMGGEGVSRIAELYTEELTRALEIKAFLFTATDSSAGAPQPETLAADFFALLREEYDVIVVDSGGLLQKPGSLSFLDACDAAILVIEADRTTRPQAGKTLSELKKYGVRPIGMVLNRTTEPVPGWIKRKLSPC
ncbi:hypothetical protein P4B35_08145 [Pontiellaceae bacterium B12227]|nr:hypothetical protein [Pontiellaceae bacterium B12227]